MAERKALSLTHHFDAPIHAVWHALTQPSLLAQWWAAGDIAPIVGHTFTVDMGPWGHPPCVVQEVDEPNRLVYTFGPDWTLSWSLASVDEGTALTLVHAGFDTTDARGAYAYENMGKGWKDVVFHRLAQLLAKPM